VFGALALRASLLRQFMIATAVLAVVTAPLPFLPQVWQIAIGLFVAGLACSPVLISGMSFIERVVPGGRLTESMSWVTSGVAVGIAVASPLAGVIIDEFGARTAYWVTSGAAVLALLVGLLFLPSLRRAQAGAGQPAERVLAAGEPSPIVRP
jgi:predicted MFS family arabinose efflux permease